MSKGLKKIVEETQEFETATVQNTEFNLEGTEPTPVSQIPVIGMEANSPKEENSKEVNGQKVIVVDETGIKPKVKGEDKEIWTFRTRNGELKTGQKAKIIAFGYTPLNKQ